MIISHKHRYIFIHVPKTAGTSVATYLAHHLGPSDIMIGSWPSAMANGVRPNARTLLHTIWQPPHRIVKAFLKGRSRSLVNSGLRRHFGQDLWDHSGVADLERFDPEAWRDYFKFCF